MRRRPEADVSGAFGMGTIGFCSGIECPLINFSYIRERSIPKVSRLWPTVLSAALDYGLGCLAVPLDRMDPALELLRSSTAPRADDWI